MDVSADTYPLRQRSSRSHQRAIVVSFLLLFLITCEGFLPVIATPTPLHTSQRQQQQPSSFYSSSSSFSRREGQSITCIQLSQRRFLNPLPSSSHATALSSLLRRLRGGAARTRTTPLLQSLFLRFASFIGASRFRCIALLLVSIVIESGATLLSKRAKDTGSVLVFGQAALLYLLCMVGFNVSLAQMNVSVAYALWGAIGTTLVTISGVAFFGESMDLLKLLYLAMIVVGVVGLNLKG